MTEMLAGSIPQEIIKFFRCDEGAIIFFARFKDLVNAHRISISLLGSLP
jgi:hypothetical protein